MIDLSQYELTFPCQYPVKVFGNDEEGFFDLVVDIITRHVPQLLPGSFTTRRSSGSRYLAVSVTIEAQSRAQVDALYKELGSHERVLIVM